jgi:hypothetical protein
VHAPGAPRTIGPSKDSRNAVTDVLRHDAAVAAATTVWTSTHAYVLPLTAALPSIHGARLCSECRGMRRRLGWLDEPVPTPGKRRWFRFG